MTPRRRTVISIWSYRGWCWICRHPDHKEPVTGCEHESQESAAKAVQDHWNTAHAGRS